MFRAIGSEVTLTVVARPDPTTRSPPRGPRSSGSPPPARGSAQPLRPRTPTRTPARGAATLATAVLSTPPHKATGGVFDPRVLDAWGHDKALAGGPAGVPGRLLWPRTRCSRAASGSRPSTRRRSPGRARRATAGGCTSNGSRSPTWAEIGEGRLGGPGRGEALRGAARAGPTPAGHVVIGDGPAGEWRVGIEEAAGGDAPVLVVSLARHRVRDIVGPPAGAHRRRPGAPPRLDPRTGGQGGEGLAAVTVLGPDPACGPRCGASPCSWPAPRTCASAQEALACAATWVRRERIVDMTDGFAQRVTWRNDD